MTKTEVLRTKLSDVALEVLAGQSFEHIGHSIELPPTMPMSSRRLVLAELYSIGVIGDADGLTISGSGLVSRLRAEKFDALFG